MNKTVLVLFLSLVMVASVHADGLWTIKQTYVQHSGEYIPVERGPLIPLKGNDLFNIQTGIYYHFIPLSYGGMAISYNGLSGYYAPAAEPVYSYSMMPYQPLPLDPSVISEEFKVHATGKVYQDGIPGYYTGKKIGKPEPILFTEKPILMNDDSHNQIVLIDEGRGKLSSLVDIDNISRPITTIPAGK